eukprot:CAMPEP_0115335792 /NCGR_PEP_ID=MMETSP0270-20121206/88659_1 /TAXON_ID=71861 /ORGANISM="Scrippsiella trochoidea, Strain CCMP3099" /LENGTH=34 /DNA_ID= /DNA_START= /DNA_END= /DNA_ORIENTATION=
MMMSGWRPSSCMAANSPSARSTSPTLAHALAALL